MRKLIIAAASITALAVPAISQASAHVPHQRVTSLTTGTTYNRTPCVDTDTRPRAENHSSTDVASAGAVTPGVTVRGTRRHSNIDISGVYPNGYTWSYDGPRARGAGHDSLGQKWNSAATTIKGPVNPITVVTAHHLDKNDAEWSPDSPSGLRSHCDG